MKKRVLLLTTLLSLCLTACGGEASITPTTESTGQTNSSVETTSVETTTVEEAASTEESSSGPTDYKQVMTTMNELPIAAESSYDRIAWAMANTLVGTKQLNAGIAFDFANTKSPEIARLNYNILKETCYNYFPDIEYPEYIQDESGAGFYKDDLENIIHSFYMHEGEMYIDEIYFAERDGAVHIMLGDGEPWIMIGDASIKENAAYVLLNAPCYYGDNGGAENVYMYHVNILFRKTEESIFGLQIVYADAYTHSITIASAEATSQLPDSSTKSYGPENLIDQDHRTAWVENDPGTGVGQVITLHLDSAQPVQDVLLYNGYLATKHLYDANGKVTKVKIDSCTGYTVETDLYPYEYYGADDAELTECYPHRINFGYPIVTDTIIITITDASEGTKYIDTCISEIELH